MTKKITVVVAAALVLVLSAYLLFVVDLFAPRSKLHGYYAVATDKRLDLSHIDDGDRAAREKYGPAARTRLNHHNGLNIWEVRLDDSTVESRPFVSKLDTAYGVFAVDGPEGAKTRFPFLLALGDDDRGSAGLTPSERIKHRFGESVPATMLAFDDADWELSDCHQLNASDASLGVVNALFHIEQQRLCVVERADGRGPLLIGAAVVDGSWARPFGRKSCRFMTSSSIGDNSPISPSPLTSTLPLSSRTSR